MDKKKAVIRPHGIFNTLLTISDSMYMKSIRGLFR